MYTSFYGQGFPKKSNKNKNQDPPTAAELQASYENPPALQLSQRILDGRAVVSSLLPVKQFQNITDAIFDR